MFQTIGTSVIRSIIFQKLVIYFMKIKPFQETNIQNLISGRLLWSKIPVDNLCRKIFDRYSDYRYMVILFSSGLVVGAESLPYTILDVWPKLVGLCFLIFFHISGES